MKIPNAGNRRFTLIGIAFALLMARPVSFSHEPMLFNHIGEDSSFGLSCNNVSGFCEDSDGFIWISTQYGLNRFDGTSVKSYFSKDLKVQSNTINGLASDKSGNVWVGSSSGLSVYVRETGSFYLPRQNNGELLTKAITGISCNPQDGKIWMTTTSGMIYSANSPTSDIESHDTGLGYRIKQICFTKSEELLLLGNYGELFFYNPASGTTSVPDFVDNNIFFKNNDIKDICSYPGNPDLVYCISRQKGLFLINLKSGDIKILWSLLNNTPPVALRATNEAVFIATTVGLDKYDILLGATTRYTHNPSDIFSLSGNNLSCLFVDSRSKVWVGCYYGGVNYSIQSPSPFKTYHLCANGHSLAGNVIINFCEDRNGTIWIVSESSQLYKLVPSSGELSYSGISLGTRLVSIVSDGDDLWLTGETGVFKYNTITKQLHRIHNDYDSAHEYVVKSKDGIFITNKFYVLKYDETKDHLEILTETGGYTTRKSISDKNGVLWMETFSNGLFSLDPARSSSWKAVGKDVLDLEPEDLFTIILTNDSNVVAISKDFDTFEFDYSLGRFIKKNVKRPELQSDILSQKIVMDTMGNLWVPYDNGISCIDTENGNTMFFHPDAILKKKLCSSSFRASDGTIYFGSRDGFISFSPNKVKSSVERPKVVISDLTVNGTEANIGNINQHGRINLAANQKSFSIRICCPSTGDINMVSYRLAGFDKDFSSVPADGVISFYNLKSGKYALSLAFRTTDGRYISCHDDIVISIAKPFLLTLPGIMILILGIVAFAGIIFFYTRYSAKRKAKEELIQEKISFFSGVIHEIKTPLTLISSPLKNILGSSENFSSEVKEDLRAINTAADYITNLISELMSYLKSEDANYKISKDRVDICQIVNGCLQKLKGPAESKKIFFQTYGLDTPVSIEADEHALEKIINNIIQNAIRYASKLIVVRLEQKEKWINLLIGNDGPIIPENIREKIFEPFFQYGTPAGAPNNNFGIGLAFSRKLASLHGGNLTLNSKQGTEFILSLPLGDPQIDKQVSFEETMQIEKNENTQKQYRILIVEDNRTLANFTGRKLSTKYETETTTSAEEALKIIKQGNIDIVVTDIVLEEMTGLELCKIISTDESISHIPIVVISAAFEESTKIECMKAGASIFIEKPFTIDYLLACIDNIVSKMENLKSQVINGNRISGSNFMIQENDADFLNRLEDSVENHLEDENFSVHTLCEELFMSQSTLTRKLSGILGMTPSEFIKERRLITAAQMLSQGNVIVGEVCYRVGFSSKSYFSRCFKERFGKTPSEYSNITLY